MADLNNAAKWSETDASNNAAVPDGWPSGMFPNQVEPTAQALMGALKRWWNRSNGLYASSGGLGVYAVTPSNAAFPTAYVDGERFVWKAHQASQGGDTLNWNGLGARPLYKPSIAGMVAIAANDVIAGQRVDVIYDSTLNGATGGFALMGAPTASIVSVPTGTVMDFAGAAVPTGWLLCAGQAVSRITYAALYTALGGASSPYGQGDGSTTFNLPDLRGRVTAGLDNMNGSAANRLTGAQTGGLNATALGAAGGEQGHQLTTGELAQHNHAVSDPTHAHATLDGTTYFISDTSGGGNDFAAGGANALFARWPTTAAAATGIGIQNTGGNGAHNTVQPTLALNKIIKT